MSMYHFVRFLTIFDFQGSFDDFFEDFMKGEGETLNSLIQAKNLPLKQEQKIDSV